MKKYLVSFLAFVMLLSLSIPNYTTANASTVMAYAVIGGQEVPFNVSSTDKHTINVAEELNRNNLSEQDMVTNIIVYAPGAEKATLDLSLLGDTIEGSELFGKNNEVLIENGYANFEMSEILGSFDGGEPGISISTLKELLLLLNNQMEMKVFIHYPEKVEDYTFVFTSTQDNPESKTSTVENVLLNTDAGVIEGIKEAPGYFVFEVNEDNASNIVNGFEIVSSTGEFAYPSVSKASEFGYVPFVNGKATISFSDIFGKLSEHVPSDMDIESEKPTLEILAFVAQEMGISKYYFDVEDAKGNLSSSTVEFVVGIDNTDSEDSGDDQSGSDNDGEGNSGNDSDGNTEDEGSSENNDESNTDSDNTSSGENNNNEDEESTPNDDSSNNSGNEVNSDQNTEDNKENKKNSATDKKLEASVDVKVNGNGEATVTIKDIEDLKDVSLVVVKPDTLHNSNKYKVVLDKDTLKKMKKNSTKLLIDKGDVKLNIPSGLLSKLADKDTNIEFIMEKLEAKGSLGSVYDFSIVAGDDLITEFGEDAIELIFELNPSLISEVPKDMIKVFYFNPELKKWEVVENSRYEASSKTVKAKVKHFSVYGPFNNNNDLKEAPKQIDTDSSTTKELTESTASSDTASGSEDEQDQKEVTDEGSNLFIMIIIGVVLIAGGLTFYFLKKRR
ncbi:MSCRAMM family adhesin SdrC (plasmid) [Rossellomorea sp. AcN35-11]|nr:MSCRAMM family adhesin SdrC [Rossellomorea aquimaris]WJV32157.1 MSCRAMM family adhesin SdrC [Rossellomorea sp. AcN35-11]